MIARLHIGGQTVTAVAIVLSLLIAARLSCATPTIRVEVKDSDSHRPVQNARVTIIGADGKEVSSGATDAAGVASVAEPPSGTTPKYVLVEARQYFISGLRWIDGVREYYILMTVLTVK